MNATSKSQTWAQIKSIGNPDNMLWSTPITQMQNLLQQVNNNQFYNLFSDYAPDVQQKQQIHAPKYIKTFGADKYQGKVTMTYYKDNNADKNYSNSGIKKSVLSKMKGNDKLHIQLYDPATKSNEGITLTRKQFIQFAKDNFIYHQKITGSDRVGELSTFDLDAPISISHVVQISDIKGHCNQHNTCVQQLNHVIVTNPRTQKLNCFDQCIKMLDYKCKKLGKTGVTVTEAILYIKTNQLPINICYDTVDGNNKINYAYFVESHTQTIVFNIKKELGHWSILHSISKKPEKIIKKIEKDIDIIPESKAHNRDIFVYYDFETVWKKGTNQAIPYSLSWFITDKRIDIATDNIDEYKSKAHFKTILDIPEDSTTSLAGLMLQQIAIFTNEAVDNIYMISYNGSNFDDYLLLDEISKYEFKIYATFSGKSILGMSFRNFKCWDLNKFLSGSLANNCTNFNTIIKKVNGFSHNQFQTAYENNTLKQFITDNIIELENYNKCDVLSLAEITQKFRDHIIGICESDPIKYKTISQHSYKLFKTAAKTEGIIDKIKAVPCEDMDLFIRKCLNAGRTEIMQSIKKSPVHLTGQKLSSVDVISLYPSVMLDKQNKYPAGVAKWVLTQDTSKLGFYQIRTKQRNDMPNILPKRNYKDSAIPLDWKYKQQDIFYCTTVDIEVLRKFGNQVDVIRGVEFESYITGDQLFSSLIPFKTAKTKQDIYKDKNNKLTDKYNAAMRSVCKLYLNSLSGKVIQRNFGEQTEIIKSDTQFTNFLYRCAPDSVTLNTFQNNFVVLNGKLLKSYNKESAKPSYLGVYIYSYSRKLMYNSIFSEITCQYTDTDSCLCTYADELQLRKNRPELFRLEPITIDEKIYMIKPFGTLDCEIKPEDNINEAILLQPKSYLIMNRATNNLVKYKTKGISFESDSCTYIDDKPLKSDPIRFFDEMLANGNVKVKCQQFTIQNLTNPNTQSFGIKIREVNKTIKLSENSHSILTIKGTYDFELQKVPNREYVKIPRYDSDYNEISDNSDYESSDDSDDSDADNISNAWIISENLKVQIREQQKIEHIEPTAEQRAQKLQIDKQRAMREYQQFLDQQQLQQEIEAKFTIRR